METMSNEPKPQDEKWPRVWLDRMNFIKLPIKTPYGIGRIYVREPNSLTEDYIIYISLSEHTAAIEKLQAKNDMLVKALKNAQERFAGGSETNGVLWREIACGEITRALAENEG